MLVLVGLLEILNHVAGADRRFGNVRVTESVAAAAESDLVADQDIRAAAAEQRVVAFQAGQAVDAVVANQQVVAEAAFQVFDADEGVVAVATGGGAGFQVGGHRGGGVVIGGGVVAGAAVDDVVAETADDKVFTAVAGDRVVAGVGQQDIVAGAADDGIDAVGAGDHRVGRRRRRHRQAAGGVDRQIKAEGVQRPVFVEIKLDVQ